MGRALPQTTTRLGTYEIIRLLARGGMAELFLARSVGPEGFAKLVVLKKVLPEFARNGHFVRLFLDEAKLAAGLDHPHIAHVYDMGTVGGEYFFTMEYVHGQDARSMMRRSAERGRQLPLELAVLIASTVAGALHYAHELRNTDGASLQIVHRDVSPANIVLSYDGTVKLVDFGVAKAATSTDRTRTGALKGKISYMSPEQASGAPIDRRSDIFSLGIVLWEMVTGRRLYKYDNDLQTIQKIVNSQPPPPSQFRSDCPPELERIIQRALLKNPMQRYSTAEEMQLDLEEFAREHKLAQSTVALRSHIHALFSVELAAWQEAQAQGISLAEHVVQHPELTTPSGTSDVSIDIDEEQNVATSAVATPNILRPDATPVPAAQWTYPPGLRSGVLPAQPASSPERRRAVIMIAFGSALATFGVIALVLVSGSSSSTKASEDTPTTDAVRMPLAPAPTPPPPPAPVEPAPEPAVAATEAAKPKVAPKQPIKRRPKAVKPAKPATQAPPRPPPKFDPNDPLPPRRQ